MPISDEQAREFAPCPLCRQYSHSIGEDTLAEAFRHFETMFSHRGDGIPTQFVFDEQTRDAAQVLMAAIHQATTDAEARAREEALEVAWRAAWRAEPLPEFPVEGKEQMAAFIYGRDCAAAAIRDIKSRQESDHG
jgi:hypothetical protein